MLNWRRPKQNRFRLIDGNIKYINGNCDPTCVDNAFAEHFKEACKINMEDRGVELKHEFDAMFDAYPECSARDVLTLSDIAKYIGMLKHGKAAGIDSLTAEHLWFAHPIVIVLIAILFNACIS